MLPKKRKFFPAEVENFNNSLSDQQEAPDNEDDNHEPVEENNKSEVEDVGIDLSCKTRPSQDNEVATAFRKVTNDTSASTASTSVRPSLSVVFETR